MVISNGGLFLVKPPGRKCLFSSKAVLMRQGDGNKDHKTEVLSGQNRDSSQGHSG